MSGPRFPWIAAAVGLILLAPSLRIGWQIDDYHHRLVLLGSPGLPVFEKPASDLFAILDGDATRTHELIDVGVMPWWTYEGIRVAFWRPLAAFTHWLDYQLWPLTPALMHAHSLLWFALAIVVAGALYRRVIGAAWIAGLATLLLALEDNHALPAGWIANRNAMIAGALGLLALLMHDRWRRGGWRPGMYLAPPALLLALLSSESGLGAAAYLFAHVCCLDPAPPRKRFALFAPYALVAVAWFCCYHALGYGVSGAGSYDDPMQDPVGFLALASRRLPLLLMGQWAAPATDACSIASIQALRILWIWALIVLALLLAALWPLLNRRREARFFCLGMLLATAPLCSVFPMDRVLFFTGFGAFGLIGMFLGGLRENADWLSSTRLWRLYTKLVAAVFVVIHGLVAPLLLCLLPLLIPALIGGVLARSTDSLPVDDTIAQRQLIAVNTPNAFSSSYILILRALEGLPLPTHCRTLAPAGQPVVIERLDECTLAVRPDLGFLPRPGTPTGRSKHPAFDIAYTNQRLNELFRDRDNAFKLGERVMLTGLEIEITKLSADGGPAEATFRFDVPLEHPSLCWVRFELGQGRPERYVPFTPPPVGQSVRME